MVGTYMDIHKAKRLVARWEWLRKQLRDQITYPVGTLRRIRTYRRLGAVEAELNSFFDDPSL